MKRILCLTLVLASDAAVSFAQSTGTVTNNGVAMDVKAAVAVLDADEARLTVFLLPFQPTAAEIAKLQTDDYLWILDKPSPDAKKWKSCPFGKFRLDWSFAKQSLGDATKAAVYLLGNGIAGEGVGNNLNKLPGEIEVSLVGTVKEAQDVTVTSKGSEAIGKSTFVWDLKVKTKVLAMKKG